MSQPAVNITEIDGALGALPPGSRKPLAVVGVCSGGPVNTPAAFAGSGGAKAILATFLGGPAVEAAVKAIGKGATVLLCRTAASVEGAYLDAVEASDGTVSALGLSAFAGDSEVTIAADPEPNGSYSVQVIFPIGGTVGVSGIVYQVSIDGGQTWTIADGLGTATALALGQIGDVTLQFGAGDIENGDIVSFTTTAPVPASGGTLATALGDGSSVPTIDAATHPDDDYQAHLRFISGGTVGTSGITFVWSLDGGRTESPVTALGTATSFIFPGSGGVKVDFAAGTIVAGATIAFDCVAPQWNNTELAAALSKLKDTTQDWELCEIVGPISTTAHDVIEGKFVEMQAAGKDRAWIGHVRNPVSGELAANYATAIGDAWAPKATILGSVTAGATKTPSGVSGRTYRRPLAFDYAPLLAVVSEEIDVSNPTAPYALAVSIRDVNGNPDEWDESLNPGLGDRFVTARTHTTVQGVFINNPRILCPDGSDFEFIQHRRVMNLARFALRSFAVRRLSKPIYVSKKTGFILEEEAVEFETGASTAMRTMLGIPVAGQGGKASEASFKLSRTDNVLSNKTLTGNGKVIPLAYPKLIDLGISFANPALQVIAV